MILDGENGQKQHGDISKEDACQITTFVAPKITTFDSSRQTQRKKRSFKARGDKIKGDGGLLETNILSMPISRLNVNNSLDEQYGNVKILNLFTRCLGIETSKSSGIKIHVCFTTPGSGGLVFKGGFSFLLGGSNDHEWDKDMVLNVLKEQVTFFGRCILRIEAQNVLHERWANLELKCRVELYKDGIRHVVIMLQDGINVEFGYTCIRANAIPETQAKASSY